MFDKIAQAAGLKNAINDKVAGLKQAMNEEGKEGTSMNVDILDLDLELALSKGIRHQTLKWLMKFHWDHNQNENGSLTFSKVTWDPVTNPRRGVIAGSFETKAGAEEVRPRAEMIFD